MEVGFWNVVTTVPFSDERARYGRAHHLVGKSGPFQIHTHERQ